MSGRDCSGLLQRAVFMADVTGSQRSQLRLQLQKDAGDINKWSPLSIFNPPTNKVSALFPAVRRAR